MARLSIMSRAKLALSIAPLAAASQAAKAVWIEAGQHVGRLQAELDALPKSPDWTDDDFGSDGMPSAYWAAINAREDQLATEQREAEQAVKTALAAYHAAERAEADVRSALSRGGWPSRDDSAFALHEPSPYSGGRDPADTATLQRLAALPERPLSDW